MAPSVSITGNFKDLAGNAVSSGTVTAQLTGYGSQTPVVAGVGIIDLATITAAISNGSFTLGPIYSNSDISPAGTFYMITFPAPTGTGTAGGTITKNYQLTGSGTFDLSQLVPMGTPILVGPSSVNAVLAQPFTPTSHKFITGMNSSGAFSSAQPTVDDLGNGSTTAVLNWNGDTGISRGAAGRIYVGNGTNGDRTGAVEGTNFQVQNGGGYFLKDASNGTPNLICQADNNIVFYSTNGAGASRAIWSVFAENSSAPLVVSVPLGMAASTPVQWNSDTGLSRDSAGVIDVGNGTAGDKSGSLKATSYTTASSNPAASGTVRLAAADTIAFRNAGNSADIALSKSGYDQITATGLSNRILQNFTSTQLTGAGGLSFQAAASKTIKANSLGAHGALLIRLAGSGVTASGGLANITVQFGGTNKTVLSIPGSTAFIFRLEALLANQNQTGQQLITWTSQYNSTLATQSNNTYNIDTTADQTLSLGVIFNNASDNCTFQNMLVEIMPASAAI